MSRAFISWPDEVFASLYHPSPDRTLSCDMQRYSSSVKPGGWNVQVELSLLCSPRLSQVTRVTQLLSGSHPANFSVKVSPSPRILLSKCCDRDGHDPVHSLQSYPSISLWPTDRYLKASRIATLKVYNCLQIVRAFVILEPSVPFSLPVNQY